jgi:ribonuclease HI
MPTEPYCQAFFDGGCAQQQATAGYVVFDSTGKLWFGAGLLLEPQIRTNNGSELHAAIKLLECLADMPQMPNKERSIVIFGDSELII